MFNLRMRNLSRLGLFWVCVVTAFNLFATAPNWWSNYSVFNDDMPEDSAPALQGHAKHMLYTAYLALDDIGYVGQALEAHVNSNWFIDSSYDLKPLKIGQLKFMVKPLYDRLKEMGVDYSEVLNQVIPQGSAVDYPWPESDTVNDDVYMVNQGQLKFIFSFQLPGVTYSQNEYTNLNIGGVSRHFAVDHSQIYVESAMRILDDAVFSSDFGIEFVLNSEGDDAQAPPLLDIQSQNINNLYELRTASFTVGGGANFIAPINPVLFEIAAKDLGGDINTSFPTDNNVLIDSLYVGGVGEAGHVKLVDDVNNFWEGANKDALYVNRLYVGPGSRLNLNNKKIYYSYLSIAETAVIEGYTTDEASGMDLDSYLLRIGSSDEIVEQIIILETADDETKQPPPPFSETFNLSAYPAGAQVRLCFDAIIDKGAIGGSNPWIHGHFLSGGIATPFNQEGQLINKKPKFHSLEGEDFNWQKGADWRVMHSFSEDQNGTGDLTIDPLDQIYTNNQSNIIHGGIFHDFRDQVYSFCFDITRRKDGSLILPGPIDIVIALRDLSVKETKLLLKNVRLEVGVPYKNVGEFVRRAPDSSTLVEYVAQETSLPVDMTAKVKSLGELSIEIEGGRTLEFESRVSDPYWLEASGNTIGFEISEPGNWNEVATWRDAPLGANSKNIDVRRRVELFDNFVRVKDTIRNQETGSNDRVGVIVENAIKLIGSNEDYKEAYLGGYPVWNENMVSPDHSAHPTAIIIWEDMAVAVVAVDDTYRAHLNTYSSMEDGFQKIGLRDTGLAIESQENQTLVWEIYPVMGSVDYYDVINTIRRQWYNEIDGVPNPRIPSVVLNQASSNGDELNINWNAAWNQARGIQFQITQQVKDNSLEAVHGSAIGTSISNSGAPEWSQRFKSLAENGVSMIAYLHWGICSDPLTNYSSYAKYYIGKQAYDPAGDYSSYYRTFIYEDQSTIETLFPLYYSGNLNWPIYFPWNLNSGQVGNSYKDALDATYTYLISDSDPSNGSATDTFLSADGIYFDEFASVGDGLQNPYFFTPHIELWDGVSATVPSTGGRPYIRQPNEYPDVPEVEDEWFLTNTSLVSQKWLIEKVENLKSLGKFAIGNQPAVTQSTTGLLPIFTELHSIFVMKNTHLGTPWGLTNHGTLAGDRAFRADMLRQTLEYGGIICANNWHEPAGDEPTSEAKDFYARLFPSTTVDIREGIFFAEERIVTKKSGLYRFPGNESGTVFVYNSLGQFVSIVNGKSNHRDGDKDQVRVTVTGGNLFEIRMPSDHFAIIMRNDIDTDADGVSDVLELDNGANIYSDLVSAAQFVVQDIPAIIQPGAVFNIELTFTNTGQTVWTKQNEFSLRNVDLINNWGAIAAKSYPNTSVAPGETHTFIVQCVAPVAEGTYPMTFQMTREDHWVGDIIFGDLSTESQVLVQN